MMQKISMTKKMELVNLVFDLLEREAVLLLRLQHVLEVKKEKIITLCLFVFWYRDVVEDASINRGCKQRTHRLTEGTNSRLAFW